MNVYYTVLLFFLLCCEFAFRVFLTLLRVVFFFLLIRRPPRSTRTDTLFPYTTLFRSRGHGRGVRVPALSVDEHPAWVDGSIGHAARAPPRHRRSEEHTSELQSLMRISYAVFCLKKKKRGIINNTSNTTKHRIDIIESQTNACHHLSTINNSIDNT